MLTSLEIETARLVRYGYTNKMIAQEHHVTVGTVKNRLNKIYKKMGFTKGGRVALAVWVAWVGV